MLKSCVWPCEVLIASRHLTVTQYGASRFVVAPTQLRRQLRQASSKTRGQYSRWGNRKPSPSTTEPAASSKTNNASPESTTEPRAESQNYKFDTKIQPQAGQKTIAFRQLLTNAVKPIPDQDLASTRPAELESVLPAEKDEAGNISITARASYFFRLGKSYVKFYKTGVKHIWNNRKEYNKIKARLGRYTPDDAALYGGQVANRSDDGTQVVKIPTITRREYQLCLRTQHDLGKLIPFGIVFLICGEFTPIVILALGSSVVPYTCRIPKQVQHDRRWFEKRTEPQAGEQVISQAANQMTKYQNVAPDGGKQDMNAVNALAFLHGVSPIARLPPVIGGLLFSLWIWPRIARRGREILADTLLIRREGGFSQLETTEVYEYANRFFCPELVFHSRNDLKKHGEISWDRAFAEPLAQVLESYSTAILEADWERWPEHLRYQRGFVFDTNYLARMKEVVKESDVGELPPWDKSKAK